MKILKYIIFILLIQFISLGCKKYTDGYYNGLKSSNKRLEGHWDIIKYLIDGQDSTQKYKELYTSYIIFNNNKKDKSKEPNYTLGNDSILNGLWGFSGFQDKGLFLGMDYNAWFSYDTVAFPFQSKKEIDFVVRLLTNRKLNVETTINGLDFRIELEKRK